jgi:CRP-like cAMP-binding protein
MSFFDYPTDDEEGTPAGEQYFLPGSSEQDWAVIVGHTHRRRFAAGESVIEPGAVDRTLYLVTEGTLEALAPEGRRGRPRRLSAFGTRAVFGELSFFDGQPRSARVRAVTDGSLAQLTPADFEALAASHPDLARAILFDLGRILAGRLRQAQSFVGIG